MLDLASMHWKIVELECLILISRKKEQWSRRKCIRQSRRNAKEGHTYLRFYRYEKLICVKFACVFYLRYSICHCKNIAKLPVIDSISRYTRLAIDESLAVKFQSIESNMHGRKRGGVCLQRWHIRWQWDSGAPPRKIGHNLRWCSVNEAPQYLAVNACKERERKREGRHEKETRDATQHGIIRSDVVNWRWRHRAEPIRQFVYWRWRIPRGLSRLIECSSIETDTGTR